MYLHVFRSAVLNHSDVLHICKFYIGFKNLDNLFSIIKSIQINKTSNEKKNRNLHILN